MLGMTYGTASVRNGCVWEEDRVEGFHSFARDAQYQQIRNDNNTVTQAQYFFRKSSSLALATGVMNQSCLFRISYVSNLFGTSTLSQTP